MPSICYSTKLEFSYNTCGKEREFHSIQVATLDTTLLKIFTEYLKSSHSVSLCCGPEGEKHCIGEQKYLKNFYI